MSRNKKIVSIFFLLIFMVLGHVQAQMFEVSLLTCGPGEELYSSFGHSAIRIRQTGSQGRDLVFNFGTFDFNTPNFYGKFATGKLNYMLSVSTYDQFVVEYYQDQREIREQVLDLSAEQKDFLLQHLEAQYDPARRFYKYDFFFNNCATKIRDAFEIAIGRQLVWNDPVNPEEKTFRDLIDEYVYPLPWADLGIDLALGAVIDRDATEREEQYLPDYMEQAFARATLEGDGPTRPLVKESRIILEFPEKADPILSLLNPYLIFWLVAVIYGVLTFLDKRKGKITLGLDVIFFGVLGLLGFLIVFLWFFTDHTATKWNWNLLWAFPGHLILAIALLKKNKATWIGKYLLAALVLAVLALFIWILGIQSFHPSLVPLFLVLFLRANFLYYNLDQGKKPGLID